MLMLVSVPKYIAFVCIDEDVSHPLIYYILGSELKVLWFHEFDVVFDTILWYNEILFGMIACDVNKKAWMRIFILLW